MEKIMLTYNTVPTTKKNSQQLVKAHGRLIPIPSKQYRAFEKIIIETSPLIETINTPVNIKCIFYMPTRRKVDLTNLLEAIDDSLVKAKIIGDDNCGIVVSHDFSRVKYDKEHPRIEIEITDATDVDENFRKDATK